MQQRREALQRRRGAAIRQGIKANAPHWHKGGTHGSVPPLTRKSTAAGRKKEKKKKKKKKAGRHGEERMEARQKRGKPWE